VVASSGESSRIQRQRSEREKKWWRAVAKARESKGNAVNAEKSGGEQWREERPEFYPRILTKYYSPRFGFVDSYID
jgi:hypothetical protein